MRSLRGACVVCSLFFSFSLIRPVEAYNLYLIVSGRVHYVSVRMAVSQLSLCMTVRLFVCACAWLCECDCVCACVFCCAVMAYGAGVLPEYYSCPCLPRMRLHPSAVHAVPDVYPMYYVCSARVSVWSYFLPRTFLGGSSWTLSISSMRRAVSSVSGMSGAKENA